VIAATTDAAYAERLLTRDDVAYPTPPPLGEANLENARRVLEGRFLFIGEEYRLEDGFSWTVNPSRDKEWRIAWHKHYFTADLVHAYAVTGDAAYLRRFAELLGSWLDEMGTGFIAQSDAQVEAKRVESWITALTLLRGVQWRGIVDGALLERWVRRMGDEALYISTHLKRVRNHRTFQLSSVFAVGVLFPELEQSAHLRELGRALLTENLLTDLLSDGVHVEQSTHYHQLVTETTTAFVELSQRNGVPVDPELLERLHGALRFCAWAQWPDAGLPLVNDSDAGDLRPVLARGARLFADPELEWAATLGAAGRPPAARGHDFAHSGYVVLTDDWSAGAAAQASRQHVLYDCALLGEGSHSHYDLFSFTYFAAGGPFVVDPGRFTYSNEPDADGVDWRHHFKSTAAHNTVQIDGLDQTRYLSRTKHGPDVAIEGRTVALGGDLDWVRARAVSREYAPVHERVLAYPGRRYLLLVDRVDMTDGAAHACDLRFHFDDSLAPALDASDEVARVTTERGGVHCLVASGGGRVALEDGWVSREYGVKHEAGVLRASATSAAPVIFVSAVAPRGVTISDVRWDATRGVAEVSGEADGAPFVDRVTVGPFGAATVEWRGS
jgi:heparinase II/III-like protein